MSVALRPYQHDALAAIADAAARGVSRQLVHLPTGTGKTIIFAALIAARGGRALVLVHRDELVTQAVDKIRLFLPDAAIGIVKGDRNECDAAIIVGSVQTLSRPGRLAQLTPPDFATIIVDEAHHAAAPTYRRILDALGVGGFADPRVTCIPMVAPLASKEASGPLLVGVTATPERADGVGLAGVFDEITFSRDLPWAIASGYLANLRAVRVHLADLDLRDVHVRGGDFVASELDSALRAANAPAHAVQAYADHGDGRRALIFTPTVASAHDMAAAFGAAGYAADALDGTTPADDRRAMLTRLHAGTTTLIANCGVLTEGVDVPAVSCILLARPTRSQTLFAQMVGRGTRPFPGKSDCLVIDLVGATADHTLITVATLIGADLSLKRDEGSTDVFDAGAWIDARARDAASGRLIAQAVDLFARHRLHWVQIDRRFVLPLPAGLLVLSTTDGVTFTAAHVQRDRTRVVLATDLPLDYAQGVAEDFARAHGAGPLVQRDAAWRHAPATDRQLDALRRFRVRIPPNLTKGDASDLLTIAVAGVA